MDFKIFTVLLVTTLCFRAHGNPLQAVADALTGAMSDFIDLKTDGILSSVEDEVGAIQNEVNNHADQLKIIEQEVQQISETGSVVDCHGLFLLGYCWFLVNQKYSLDTAERSCERSGAVLASLDRQDDMEALHEYIIHSYQITDKSTVFVWTSSLNGDSNSVLDNTDNWMPGFPSTENSDATNIMWQIMGEDFYLYHGGFLNASPEFPAYPLCRKFVISDTCLDVFGSAPTCSQDNTECSDSACVCLPGYEGSDPENEACTDICHDVLGNAPVCSQDYTRCHEGECACLSGFDGNDPANEACADVDDCAPVNPCVHGTCTDSGPNSYSCTCDDGWTGDQCDTERTCDGGKLVGEVCYFVGPAVNVRDTDEHAQQLCPSMDSLSHMAYIKTTEQMEAVLQLLADYMQSQGLSGGIAAYLGGTYSVSSNTITYLDGEAVVVPSEWWWSSPHANYERTVGVRYHSSSANGLINDSGYGITTHNYVLCQK